MWRRAAPPRPRRQLSCVACCLPFRSSCEVLGSYPSNGSCCAAAVHRRRRRSRSFSLWRICPPTWYILGCSTCLAFWIRSRSMSRGSFRGRRKVRGESPNGPSLWGAWVLQSDEIAGDCCKWNTWKAEWFCPRFSKAVCACRYLRRLSQRPTSEPRPLVLLLCSARCLSTAPSNNGVSWMTAMLRRVVETVHWWTFCSRRKWRVSRRSTATSRRRSRRLGKSRSTRSPARGSWDSLRALRLLTCTVAGLQHVHCSTLPAQHLCARVRFPDERVGNWGRKSPLLSRSSSITR